MRTKKIFASVCMLSAIVLYSSCDWVFSENYGAKGFLSATLSDNGALPAAPEEIQVRYYDNYSNEEYTEKLGEPDCFASDGNFLSRVRTGEYRFLAYSTFNNKVRNSSDITQIEIYADTVNSENMVFRSMPISYARYIWLPNQGLSFRKIQLTVRSLLFRWYRR